MAQAYAITTLHVCREPAEMKDGRVTKPPTIEVIHAGSIADIPDADFKEFEAAGAVRKPTKIDRATAEGEDEPDQVEAVAGRATASHPARGAR